MNSEQSKNGLLVAIVIALAVGVAVGYLLGNRKGETDDGKDRASHTGLEVCEPKGKPASYYVAVGDAHYRHGAPRHALASFELGLENAEVDAQRAPILAAIGTCYLVQKDTKMAQESFDKALAMDVENNVKGMVHRRIAEACLKAEAYPEAEKYARAWIEFAPAGAARNDAYLALTKSMEKQKKLDALINDLDAQLKKNDQDKAVLTALRYVYTTARPDSKKLASILHKQIDSASVSLEKATLSYRAAQQAYRQKQYPKAISYMRDAISLTTNSAMAASYHAYLARIYESNKEPRKAQESLQYVIDHGRQAAERTHAGVRLIALCQKEKTLPQLLQNYEGRMVKQPKNVNLLMFLAQVYMTVGDQRKARTCLERILLLDKNNDQAMAKLLDVYPKTREYEKATQLLEKLIKRHPGNAEAYYYQLGIAYHNLAKTRKSLEWADKLALLPPKLPMGHMKAAELYARNNRQDKARHHFSKALARTTDPRERFTYQLRMSQTYTEAGQYDLAQEILEDIIARNDSVQTVATAKRLLQALNKKRKKAATPENKLLVPQP